MLLYWKKRRHLTYTTAFLELDLSLIRRSIAKVNKYFEDKLPKNELV
mgnify:CR=1 FL=1